MTQNFAWWLADRIGGRAELVDAATSVRIGSGEAGSGPSVADAIRLTAMEFKAVGVRPGSIIGILTDISSASVLAYLGAMYAGGVVVPVDAARGVETLRRIVQRIDLSAVWIPSVQTRAVIEPFGLQNTPVLTGLLLDRQTRPVRSASSDEGAASNPLAALMPTSGTTGTPRLVRVSHANLITNTVDIIRTQELAPDDRGMLVVPLSYCFGASIVHSHLAAGGDVVLDRRMMFPDQVVESIERHGCTTFAGVPTVYSRLLGASSLAQRELGSLRRWLQAGGRLPLATVDVIRSMTPEVGFYIMYGQTEATARISCLQPRDFERKRGSVGEALPSVKVSVAAQTGEILVSGPSVSDGYWNDPEATAERFRDGWLRTGDRGRFDDDGFLWVEGRIADFVKIAGLRLDLSEVESRLRDVNGVANAAAVGIPHPAAGEALAIFLVPEPGLASDHLVASVRAQLPTHWVVGAVQTIFDLPTNANGKIERARLAEMAGLPDRWTNLGARDT